nr:hypothetical protein [Tanacetum cinerariifolium]
MAIPTVMLNDEIKASAEYSEYVTKFKGSNLSKLETVVEEVGQSTEVADDIDSEETGEDEEHQMVRRRQAGVVIGSEVALEVPDRLSHKGPNEGSGVTLVVLDKPTDDLEKVPDSMKADDVIDAEEQAEEESAGEEHHVDDQGGNKQAGQAHLKKILQKDVPDFGKSKLQKVAKKSTPKYSSTLFDQAALDEYDQKDKKDVKITMIKILKQIQKRRRKRESKNETIHEVEMEIKESIEDDVVNAEDATQADAITPIQDKSTWFKTIVVKRPESPDLEWHKEPTTDDAPKQTWFNEIVNVEKNQLTFDHVMDQLNWVNPEGDIIPHDYSKPLPLHGAPGHLTILVDFFFNKDLEYLTTRNVEKKYDTSLIKSKAARYDLEGIEEMTPQLWSSTNVAYDKYAAYGITEVKDVQLRVESYQIKHNLMMLQARFAGLDNKEPYTIFHKSIGVVYLKKDDKKYPMREEEVYKFGDGTLKKVHDELNYRLHNFVLRYNDGMPKRAWSKTDQKRTKSMLKEIEKTLLKRWIMMSLECFVGDRGIEMDYRLLTQTK